MPSSCLDETAGCELKLNIYIGKSTFSGPDGSSGQLATRPLLSPARARFLKSGTWKSRNLGSKKSKKQQFSKSKSVLPKMSARSGLAGKTPSRPHLGPSRAIFCVGRKNLKIKEKMHIFLGGPMGPIHPVWALAAIHPRWGNRYCQTTNWWNKVVAFPEVTEVLSYVLGPLQEDLPTLTAGRVTICL